MVKEHNQPAKKVSKDLNIPIKNLLRWLELGAIRKKGKYLIMRRRKEDDGPLDGTAAVPVDEGGTETGQRSHCQRLEKNVHEFHSEIVQRFLQGLQRLVGKVPQKEQNHRYQQGKLRQRQ